MSTWVPPRTHPYPDGTGRRPPAPSRAPVATLAIGVIAVVAALVVAPLSFIRPSVELPTAVLAADGSAGDGVVATADVPGTTPVKLVPGRTYDLYLVTDGVDTALADRVTVLDYEGDWLVLDDDSAGLHVEAGPTRAELLGTVEAYVDDDHTVVAGRTVGGHAATIYVVNAQGTGPATDPVVDTVAGIVAAFLLFGFGLVLVTIGLSLEIAARARARRAEQPGW